MQLLSSGYKRLKIFYVFFIHYIDSKFLWYVHNLFIIKFYNNHNIIIIITIQSSKN
jgi:hypothetical protein